MRTIIKAVIIILILATLGYFGGIEGQKWLAERNKPRFRKAIVEQGDLRITVNATGQLEPTLSVKISSFVSGPVLKLHVDHNDDVKAGQILAKIDPRIYIASVERDEAALGSRVGDVARVQAELQRARNDEKRSVALKAENEDFISQAELDQFCFARMSLEAQLIIADSSVKQAQANLDNSKANLNYTEITSPVDGTVIDKIIEEGGTLAAQFQAPELFVIAPRMREEMLIRASIDEADIGLIRDAKDSNQPVYFSVDAYPEKVFSGATIRQIRLSSTTTQNVVTYPVIVSTTNPDLKLLPGMTANLTFQIKELKDILKVPNSALRYFPDKTLVREEDLNLLELNLTPEQSEDRATSSETPPVDDIAVATIASSKRIVWIQETRADRPETVDGKSSGASSSSAPGIDPAKILTGKLRGIRIEIGDSDYQFTQVLKGDIKAGDELIAGVKPPEAL
ncbi:MAG: efflux RND transporter periplasmic adaptor subunit [Planctomycetota bacterium]|nr:efflux RND transporter periplasmic adaptor subunit [Planctomycetota bacterium]